MEIHTSVKIQIHMKNVTKKKGTKVKANLVKNVYSTGEVEYRMTVE